MFDPLLFIDKFKKDTNNNSFIVYREKKLKKNTVYIVCTISTILIILGIVSIVFDFKWPLL